MRIGMFADMYLPHVSGVTNHIALYAEGLDALGHEVTIFTFGDLDYQDTGARVVRSPALPWGSTGWKAALGLSDEARRSIAELDVAHAHHPYTSCRTALRHCGKRGVPVVFTSHSRYDLYSDVYAAYVPQGVRYAAISSYLRWLAARVSLTVSPSREISAWLASLGVPPERMIVFPNGIDTQRFRSPSSPLTKRDLGFGEDDLVACFVGRIAREKNVGLLLDAFERARAQAPSLRLVLVGDGPSMEETRQTIADRSLSESVLLAGARAYEQIPDLLAACDLFVTASVTEVYPLVVIEAQAAGLPVVGVWSPGVSEIVADEDSGLLCAEDAQMIAAALVNLATDQALRQRLAAGALDVAARHDIRASSTALADIYGQLLEHAGFDQLALART